MTPPLSTPMLSAEPADWRGKRALIHLIILFAILGTLFFGLGYLYGAQEKPAPIVIEQCADVDTPR